MLLLLAARLRGLPQLSAGLLPTCFLVVPLSLYVAAKMLEARQSQLDFEPRLAHDV